MMAVKAPEQITPLLVLGLDQDNRVVCVISKLPSAPTTMGLMLADMIRHIANAYCGAGDSTAKSELVLNIMSGLNAEMSSPTTETHIVTRSGQMGEMVIPLAGITNEED